MRKTAAIAIFFVAVGPARAQEPTPSPTPETQEPKPVALEDLVLPTTPRSTTVREPGPRKDRSGDSEHAGPLKGVRALSIEDGEARLLIEGVERLVREGDAIGEDVVTRITPGRIVLARAPTERKPAGEATVVVHFDAAGRSRVRVYMNTFKLEGKKKQ